MNIKKSRKEGILKEEKKDRSGLHERIMLENK